MTKQELAHIAKVMYDLQGYCPLSNGSCIDCSIMPCRLSFTKGEYAVFPYEWGITLEDIERLKRIEGELRVKVPVEWLKSAVQANKELERENNESN